MATVILPLRDGNRIFPAIQFINKRVYTYKRICCYIDHQTELLLVEKKLVVPFNFGHVT